MAKRRHDFWPKEARKLALSAKSNKETPKVQPYGLSREYTEYTEYTEYREYREYREPG